MHFQPCWLYNHLPHFCFPSRLFYLWHSERVGFHYSHDLPQWFGTATKGSIEPSFLPHYHVSISQMFRHWERAIRLNRTTVPRHDLHQPAATASSLLIQLAGSGRASNAWQSSHAESRLYLPKCAVLAQLLRLVDGPIQSSLDV